MDTFKTHGAFSWSELMTSDPQAASEFYGSLFGWTVSEMDMGPAGTYRVAKVGDTSICGIQATPPEAGQMPPMWGSYVTVDDVDATVAKCKALGGKVCMEPMDVPTVGRMATLQDPQGAMINVITYAMEQGKS